MGIYTLRLAVILLGLLGALSARSQVDSCFQQALTPRMAARLQAMQAQLCMPPHLAYQLLPPSDPEDFFATDGGFAVRRAKLECHVRLEPEPADGPKAGLPHLRVMPLLTHLASNEEESVIAGHEVDRQSSGADWAMDFFFKPKDYLSSYRNARMQVRYKNDAGFVYILTFFDEPSMALDNLQLTVHFNMP